MTKIVIDMEMTPADLATLRALDGVRVETITPSNQSRELPLELIADADFIACRMPPKNQAEMRRLKFIQISSVGYAQLYGLELVRRGVRAANARGVFDAAIAEWNIAMMINLGRDLRTMIRNQDAGRWEVRRPFTHEIRGSTVGLWGYGGIGRETARLAKSLGMRVHALVRRGVSDRSNTYCVAGIGDPDGSLPDRVFKAGEELDFLTELDFLILAMPLTPANTGLIGERELWRLRPTAFLLNPARGPIVQEAALLKALDEGWIAGAALDTHFYYPMPPDHPLWRKPNVIMTPHVSGSELGPHFVARMGEIFVHNVRSLLAGKPLWNELTADELEGR